MRLIYIQFFRYHTLAGHCFAYAREKERVSETNKEGVKGVYSLKKKNVVNTLPSILACSITFGGAENGADGGLSTGVETLNSLCGRATGSPTIQKYTHCFVVDRYVIVYVQMGGWGAC